MFTLRYVGSGSFACCGGGDVDEDNWLLVVGGFCFYSVIMNIYIYETPSQLYNYYD